MSESPVIRYVRVVHRLRGCRAIKGESLERVSLNITRVVHVLFYDYYRTFKVGWNSERCRRTARAGGPYRASRRRGELKLKYLPSRIGVTWTLDLKEGQAVKYCLMLNQFYFAIVKAHSNS